AEDQAFADIGVADGALFFPVAFAVGSVGYDADEELAWFRETTPVEVPTVSSFRLAPLFATCSSPPRSDGPRRTTIVSVNAEGCGRSGQRADARGLAERVTEHNRIGGSEGHLTLIEEDPPIVGVALPRGAARQFDVVGSPGWLVAVFVLGPSEPGTLDLDLAYAHWA